MNEVGHVFLARLGKTCLRPGGKVVTQWLMSQAKPKGKKVLEVACNQGTTLKWLAQQGCEIVGVDLDQSALDRCRENLKRANINSVQLRRANACNLPFGDGEFDLVVNEAMLTMLPAETRLQAVKEYVRVLKPGGMLLSHDVALQGDDHANLSSALSRSINASVYPQSQQQWVELFRNAGFASVESKLFPFELLTKRGMLRDEGLLGMMKILWRARRPENRQQFQKMRTFFSQNRDQMSAIGVVSHKI